MKHLWEIDHPYYAADGHENECESFEHLRHDVDQCDEDMNLIYRWDWIDWQQPFHDDLFVPGEYRSKKQTLRIHMVQPRKSQFISFTCPVTHDDEPAVLAWLRGPRVAGYLRLLWEPVLDDVTGPTPGQDADADLQAELAEDARRDDAAERGRE